MKQVTSVLLFLATFFFLAVSGRGEEPQTSINQPQLFSSSDAGLPPFVEAGKNALSPASNKSLVLLNLDNNNFTLKTQYAEKYDDKPRLLTAPDRSQEQFGLLATSSVFGRYLTAEGELAYSSSPSLGPRPQSLFDFGETQNRMLRFGLKGTVADFAYGAEYRSVGKDFFNLNDAKIAKDQEGGEVWLQKSFGIFGFKLSGSEFTNNVARDPALPQISKLQGGASASVSPQSWPTLSIFYYRGLQRSSNEPPGSDTQNGSLDSFGASLYYKGSQWDGTLAATYSMSDIMSRSGKGQNAGRYYERTMSPGMSFGFNYYPSILPVQLTAYGAYSKTATGDKYTNSDVLNLGAALNWKLGGSGAAKSTLSVGAGFNAYLDKVNSYNSNHDVSVWTRLKVPVF